ncbi:Vesicle-mediated ER to Golgi transport protein [Cryptotrichosporon argae]
MNFLSSARITSAYNAVRGELQAAPQTATDTIGRLVDKIQTSAAVEDRRTAVLGLKGLSRDWKAEVSAEALPSLLAVLQHDAPFDVDIAKAVLETLMQLCEVPENPPKDDLGLLNTDAILETPQPVHSVLALLSSSPSFYPRFYSLQFLSQLLTSRPAPTQAYLMSAPPPGIDGVLSVLDAKSAAAPQSGGGMGGGGMGGGVGEMLRNEALLLLPAMLAGNADLQKIVAFSGAFEKLLDIVNSEGGVDGGIVVQDALTVAGNLLRFNVSNQNYFRELSLIPTIPPILGFPSPLAADVPAPDDFALQYWPEQKLYNTGLVLGLIRMLIGGPGGGNQSAMVPGGVTRCLLELALASNAPNGLKCQALNTLTPIMLSSVPNQTLLSTLMLAPLVAVNADETHPNGGFVRLPLKPAVVALVSTVIHGDASAGGRGLRGRAAGVNMFEAFVTGNDDARIGVLSSMVPPPADNPNSDFPDQPQSAGSLILAGLLDANESPLDPYRPLFSCLLLSHLVRNSEHAKKLAREITLPSGDSAIADDDDKVGLVQLVVGNLMMASREQTEAANRAAKGETGAGDVDDWTRVMVGYLVLLCTWLWDSPKTVKDFLSESANLQVLIGPITQPTGIDPLVQGLCAFLLGVCYEFNREPGEITRATLHPILHARIGPDQFVSRMARLREDPRFKAVQPDAFDTEGEDATAPADGVDEPDEGLELWFDWAFVDFWKNHYYTIQRSIAVDPDAVRAASTRDDSETAAIIMGLRQKLKAQTDEVVGLQNQLSGLQAEHAKEKDQLVSEVTSLSEQLAAIANTATNTAELDSVKAELAQALLAVQTAVARGDKAEARAAELEAGGTDVAAARAELAAAIEERDRAKADVAAIEVRVGELEKRAEAAEAKAATSTAAAEAAQGEIQGNRDELAAARAELASAQAELATARSERDAAHADADAAKAAAVSAGAAGGAGGESKPGEGKNKLKEKVRALEAELAEHRAKAADSEKEHEDLLVLLEEMSEKRRRDKERLRAHGDDVSEGEDDDDA